MQLDELTQQNAALVEQASAGQPVHGRAGALAAGDAVALPGVARGRAAAAAAAMTAGGRQVGHAQPARVERRGAARPWAGKDKGGEPARKTRAVRDAVANGTDSEWQAF